MRKLFANNTTIKILSIIAAIVMWLYVMNEQNPQVTYVIRDVPVKLLNLDDSKFALKDNSSEFTVNVKVKGRRSLVADLKPNDINADVNMRGRMEGDNLIRVDVNTPPNVEFIDVSPREVMVNLDAIIEEQMPVVVDVSGTPMPGFEAAPASTKPQAVVVKGPRTMVNAVKKVSTRIDISDTNSTLINSLPIRVLDGKGKEQKEVSFRPDVVEVTVPIVPVSNVQILPNITGNPPEGYIIRDVRIDPPKIKVTGNDGILNTLQSINTEPINIESKTSTVSTDVKLNLPQGVTTFSEEIQSAQVTVEIEKLATTTLEATSSEIELSNIPPEIKVDLEHREFTLTVSGPESIIDKVNKNMIKLNIDVSGLTEGEHLLKVNSDISRPYRIIQIEPGDILVTLSNFSQ
ncbi:MAG: CdaR family protein [Eubacteriales bacterium]|nr:CdaR family protein [Eubacteriales bacterium]